MLVELLTRMLDWDDCEARPRVCCEPTAVDEPADEALETAEEVERV